MCDWSGIAQECAVPNAAPRATFSIRTDFALRNTRELASGVRKPAMNEEITQTPRPASEPPQALVSGTSAKEAADLLFQLLIEVVRERTSPISSRC